MWDLAQHGPWPNRAGLWHLTALLRQGLIAPGWDETGSWAVGMVWGGPGEAGQWHCPGTLHMEGAKYLQRRI